MKSKIRNYIFSILDFLERYISNLVISFLPLLLLILFIRRAECEALLYGLYGKILIGQAFSLSLFSKLSFYTDDIYVLLGFFPLFFGVLLTFFHFSFGKNISVYLRIFLINVISLIIISEHLAVLTTGSYVNFPWLKSTISWMLISQPEVILSPTIGMVLKFIYVLFLPNVLFSLSEKFTPINLRRILSVFSLILAVFLLQDKAPIKEGISRKAVLTFLDINNLNSRTNLSDPSSNDPLINAAKLRDVLNINSKYEEPSTLYSQFSKLKGYDVILIVNETLPSQVVDFSDKTLFPNISNFLEKGVYIRNHYTTFPYTNSSTYSILTSQFPSNRGRSYLQMFSTVKSKSLFSILKKNGYSSAVFSPLSLSFDSDNLLYKSLGVDELFEIPNKGDDKRVSLQDRAKADEDSFNEMLDYISEKVRSNKNYISLYLPFLGHGPWPEVNDLIINPPDNKLNQSDYLKRRALIASYHDTYLGKLIEKLKLLGTLDKTIFLITGDHGARTSFDYPDLRAGVINEISYKVPLVIYANGVDLSNLNNVSTTHLDIMPTILELLGIKEDREFELGLPIWKAKDVDRPIFLLGKNYLGSDGLMIKDKSYSYNTQLDLVYEDTKNNLSFNTLKISNKEESDKVKNLILEVGDLQDSIIFFQNR